MKNLKSQTIIGDGSAKIFEGESKILKFIAKAFTLGKLEREISLN